MRRLLPTAADAALILLLAAILGTADCDIPQHPDVLRDASAVGSDRTTTRRRISQVTAAAQHVDAACLSGGGWVLVLGDAVPFSALQFSFQAAQTKPDNSTSVYNCTAHATGPGSVPPKRLFYHVECGLPEHFTSVAIEGICDPHGTGASMDGRNAHFTAAGLACLPHFSGTLRLAGPFFCQMTFTPSQPPTPSLNKTVSKNTDTATHRASPSLPLTTTKDTLSATRTQRPSASSSPTLSVTSSRTPSAGPEPLQWNATSVAALASASRGARGSLIRLVQHPVVPLGTLHCRDPPPPTAGVVPLRCFLRVLDPVVAPNMTILGFRHALVTLDSSAVLGTYSAVASPQSYHDVHTVSLLDRALYPLDTVAPTAAAAPLPRLAGLGLFVAFGEDTVYAALTDVPSPGVLWLNASTGQEIAFAATPGAACANGSGFFPASMGPAGGGGPATVAVRRFNATSLLVVCAQEKLTLLTFASVATLAHVASIHQRMDPLQLASLQLDERGVIAYAAFDTSQSAVSFFVWNVSANASSSSSPGPSVPLAVLACRYPACAHLALGSIGTVAAGSSGSTVAGFTVVDGDGLVYVPLSTVPSPVPQLPASVIGINPGWSPSDMPPITVAAGLTAPRPIYVAAGRYLSAILPSAGGNSSAHGESHLERVALWELQEAIVGFYVVTGVFPPAPAPGCVDLLVVVTPSSVALVCNPNNVSRGTHDDERRPLQVLWTVANAPGTPPLAPFSFASNFQLQSGGLQSFLTSSRLQLLLHGATPLTDPGALVFAFFDHTPALDPTTNATSFQPSVVFASPFGNGAPAPAPLALSLHALANASLLAGNAAHAASLAQRLQQIAVVVFVAKAQNITATPLPHPMSSSSSSSSHRPWANLPPLYGPAPNGSSILATFCGVAPAANNTAIAVPQVCVFGAGATKTTVSLPIVGATCGSLGVAASTASNVVSVVGPVAAIVCGTSVVFFTQDPAGQRLQHFVSLPLPSNVLPSAAPAAVFHLLAWNASTLFVTSQDPNAAVWILPIDPAAASSPFAPPYGITNASASFATTVAVPAAVGVRTLRPVNRTCVLAAGTTTYLVCNASLDGGGSGGIAVPLAAPAGASLQPLVGPSTPWIVWDAVVGDDGTPAVLAAELRNVSASANGLEWCVRNVSRCVPTWSSSSVPTGCADAPRSSYCQPARPALQQLAQRGALARPVVASSSIAAGQLFFLYCSSKQTTMQKAPTAGESSPSSSPSASQGPFCYVEGVCAGSISACADASAAAYFLEVPLDNASYVSFSASSSRSSSSSSDGAWPCTPAMQLVQAWGILVLHLPDCHVMALDVHAPPNNATSASLLWSTRDTSSVLASFRSVPAQHQQQQATDADPLPAASLAQLLPGTSILPLNLVRAHDLPAWQHTTLPAGGTTLAVRSVWLDVATGAVTADHGAALFGAHAVASSVCGQTTTSVAAWRLALSPLAYVDAACSTHTASPLDAMTRQSLYAYAVDVAALCKHSFSVGWAGFAHASNPPLQVAARLFAVVQAVLTGLPPSWRPWVAYTAWVPSPLAADDPALLALTLLPPASPSPAFPMLTGFVNGSAVYGVNAALREVSSALTLGLLQLGSNPALGGFVDLSRIPASVQVFAAERSALMVTLDVLLLPPGLEILNLDNCTTFALLPDPLILPPRLELLLLSGEFVRLRDSSPMTRAFLQALPPSLKMLKLNNTLLAGNLSLDFSTAANVSAWSLHHLIVAHSPLVTGDISSFTAASLPPQLVSLCLDGLSLAGSLGLHECVAPDHRRHGDGPVTSSLNVLTVAGNQLSGQLHLANVCPSLTFLNVSGNIGIQGAVEGFPPAAFGNASTQQQLLVDIAGTNITEIVAPACPLTANNSRIVFISNADHSTTTGGTTSNTVPCVQEAAAQISQVPLCDATARYAMYPYLLPSDGTAAKSAGAGSTVYLVPLFNVTVTEDTTATLHSIPLYAFTATARSGDASTLLLFPDEFLWSLSRSPALPLPPRLGNATDANGAPGAVVAVFRAGTPRASLVIRSAYSGALLYNFSAEACVAHAFIASSNASRWSFCMHDLNNFLKNYILNLTANGTLAQTLDKSGLYPVEKTCTYAYPMLLLRNFSVAGSFEISLFPSWLMLASANMSVCLPKQPEYASSLTSIVFPVPKANLLDNVTQLAQLVPTSLKFQSNLTIPNGVLPTFTKDQCQGLGPIQPCVSLPAIPPNAAEHDEACYRSLCEPTKSLVWQNCLGSNVRAGFVRLGQCQPLSTYFAKSSAPVSNGAVQQCPADVSSCIVASTTGNSSLPLCAQLAGRFSGLAGCLLTSGIDPFNIIGPNLNPYCTTPQAGLACVETNGSIAVNGARSLTELCDVADVFAGAGAFQEVAVRATCIKRGSAVILTACATDLPMFEFPTQQCVGQFHFACSPCIAYVDPLAHAQPLVFLFASSVKDILLILFGATVLSKPAIRRRTTKLIVSIYVSMLPYHRGEREDWTKRWFLRLNPQIVAESDFVYVYTTLMQRKQLHRSSATRKEKRQRKFQQHGTDAAGTNANSSNPQKYSKRHVSAMEFINGLDVPILFKTETPRHSGNRGGGGNAAARDTTDDDGNNRGGGGTRESFQRQALDLHRDHDAPYQYGAVNGEVLESSPLMESSARFGGTGTVASGHSTSGWYQIPEHEKDPFFHYFIQHITEFRSQIVMDTSPELHDMFHELRDAFFAQRNFLESLSRQQKQWVERCLSDVSVNSKATTGSDMNMETWKTLRDSINAFRRVDDGDDDGENDETSSDVSRAPQPADVYRHLDEPLVSGGGGSKSPRHLDTGSDDTHSSVGADSADGHRDGHRDRRRLPVSICGDLALKGFQLAHAVKKAKDHFLSLANLESVILEKAALDNKFTPQAWMLSLQLLYAITFLLICVVESGKVTYTAWTTYEAVYFRFINSSTSVGLLTNSILRRFYRFDGKHYLDFFVVSSLVILLPPLVTHMVVGLVVYFWLTLGVLAMLFLAIKVRNRLSRQRWYHQQSYRSVAYRITVRFFITAVLTFVLQMGFNYSILFYKREEFQLTYFEVVQWEMQSRGLNCFLIDAFETLTNTLQLFSIAS